MGCVKPNSLQWLSLDNLPNERWKDVENYEGVYQISNYGRVKNSTRVGSQGKQRILRVKISKNGYCSVGLSHNGHVKWLRLNRLVAEHFVPNPNKKPEVNHNDEDKHNNYYENLSWMTPKENCNYGTRIAKIVEKTRVKVDQFNTNMEFIKTWCSLTHASESLNISISHISQVCRGQRKTCGGYMWRYHEEGNDK